MIADGSGAGGPATPENLSPRRVILASYAVFALVGWTMLLVPSLIREIKADFAQSDAGFGFLYLLAALLFATGAFGSGALAGRLGRRVILPAAVLLTSAGLAIQVLAPSWGVVVLGAALTGGGAGMLDAGVNGVIMDLASEGRGSALSKLHLFYSVGALTGPLVVGALVGAGADWRVPVLFTGIVALALVAPVRAVGSVPSRPRVRRDRTSGDSAATSAIGAAPSLRVPLVALAVAIACYVATEAGVSSWLVVYLVEEPLGTATLALGLFWAGLAAGRLTAARIADRFAPVRLALTCVLLAGAALLGGILAPPGAVRIAFFAVAGFGCGPVYPMIMTVAGSHYPHRAAAVSGILTAAGVAGSVVYPPLMGLLSDTVGLGAGMFGAAVLAVVCGAAILVAGWTATRAHAGARARHPAPVAVQETGAFRERDGS